MDHALYVVIMAGGSGTRFWPASRRSRPKQFLSLADGVPMLAATRARVAELAGDEHVLVVAGVEHAALVREALPGLPPANLLLEPVGRNTLPCIALANAEILRREPDSIQAVLPADHVMTPGEAFRTSLAAAVRSAAKSGALVTLGVRPTHPATGYGYIEVGPELERSEGHPVHAVESFVEKPDRARAESFLAEERFLWNSGVFVWTTAAITAALEAHAPQLWSALRGADPGALGPLYEGLTGVSVDTGVMEKASGCCVLPVDYTWSDVGTWPSLADLIPDDGVGNSAAGGGALEVLDARGNLVYGEPGTLTALIGVQDLVVVRAGDATLVCPRERAEEVKTLVERLAEGGREHL